MSSVSLSVLKVKAVSTNLLDCTLDFLELFYLVTVTTDTAYLIQLRHSRLFALVLAGTHRSTLAHCSLVLLQTTATDGGLSWRLLALRWMQDRPTS